MTKMITQTIDHQNFIAVPPEKVYDTITSGAGWNAFFTHATEVDPRPGGSIVFRWKDWGPQFYTTEADGMVHEAVRPEKFVFEWYPIGRETSTTVSFYLTAKYGGTVLRVAESGYPDTEAGRKMILECACGWAEAITLLKFYLENGMVYQQPRK